MPKIVIDGKTGRGRRTGTTVLKAAAAAGVDIPHFCYHPAFIPEGSCRLCLVEIAGSPKLELVLLDRRPGGHDRLDPKPQGSRSPPRSVLEFLLAEHPLDCPICDKAGECKLQDYYRDYGLTESAFSRIQGKTGEEGQDRREAPPRPGALRPVHALRPLPDRHHANPRARRL